MAGFAIAWQSKRQMIVATDSKESEYVILSTRTSKAVWLGRLLHELGIKHPSYTSLPLSYTSKEIKSDY
jgi:hypothetical protein